MREIALGEDAKGARDIGVVGDGHEDRAGATRAHHRDGVGHATIVGRLRYKGVLRRLFVRTEP